MIPPTQPLCVPELDLPNGSVRVGQWLVSRGARVTQGDRVVELVAPGVVIDLPAPCSGRLIALLTAEDEPVVTGQVLAHVACDTTT